MHYSRRISKKVGETQWFTEGFLTEGFSSAISRKCHSVGELSCGEMFLLSHILNFGCIRVMWYALKHTNAETNLHTSNFRSSGIEAQVLVCFFNAFRGLIMQRTPACLCGNILGSYSIFSYQRPHALIWFGF